MTNTIEPMDSAEASPASLDTLQELVDELVRVDASSANEQELAPLGAKFLSSLQDLVTEAMRHGGSAPNPQELLTAALTQWASAE